MHANHVGHGDEREVAAVRSVRFRIDAARTARPLASPQHVGANHEVAVRVDPFARTDEPVPPSRFVVVVVVPAGNMRIARQRVADEDRVVLRRREIAESLVCDGDRSQRLSALQRQRCRRLEQRDCPAFDVSHGFHGRILSECFVRRRAHGSSGQHDATTGARLQAADRPLVKAKNYSRPVKSCQNCSSGPTPTVVVCASGYSSNSRRTSCEVIERSTSRSSSTERYSSR